MAYYGFENGPQFDPFVVRDGVPCPVSILRDMLCTPEYDSLYRSDGSRADETCVLRGPDRQNYSIGPERIDVPADAVRCDRPMVYLGTLAWNDWGHFLLEGLARVWAMKHHPTLADCRGLYFTRPNHRHKEQPHIAALITNLDCAPRLLRCDRPMLLREVHVPPVSFFIRNHAFKAHTEALARVTHRILNHKLPQTTDRPVYLSRRNLSDDLRHIDGEAELEMMLSSHGVRVVCPESLSFESQVRLYNTHRTFIGTYGSAFHSLLFSRQNVRTVVLCESQINSNYLMIDELLSIEADYVNCLSVDRQSKKIDPDRKLDVPTALRYLTSLF